MHFEVTNLNYYNEIKELLISNEITKKVKDYSKNKSDLTTYYSIGKLLIEAQGGEKRAKYGNSLIKEYSKKLTIDLNKGYSVTTLKYMRQFYLFQKGQPVVDQLSWSHYTVLLPLKDVNKINYYIGITKRQNLSRNQLREKIKSKEYERLPNETKEKLINKEQSVVSDFIKNPIVIRNNTNYEIISEKLLKRLILDDMEHFLSELGSGFCFIGSEYKIKIDDTYNYIDILLYNYIYKCFVVVELKITSLKAEHVGQITKYINYIDKNVRTISDTNTIGIILSTRNNRIVLEYCSDSRIFFKEMLIV